jgi:hypothetical protein
MPKKSAKPKAAAPASPETAAPAPTITKAEAVRQALAAGKDSPSDGTGFIKSNYGIEITSQMFSSYKAQQKARDAKQSGGAPAAKRGRKPKAAVEGYLAPPPRKGESTLLDAMEAMKPLVASLGVEQVKRIAELLG